MISGGSLKLITPRNILSSKRVATGFVLLMLNPGIR
ncbi:ORF052 [Escherichia phage T5]|uniref:ORF052 n=1 Tax=Escherichia phage T5 TaxID=2695836 RepID=Q5DMP2_BPT5|nr:ORF052 [Escherichia phage T5]